MVGYFRAVALDFDGTITDGELPSSEVLDALAKSRRAGRKAILVTGRILEELRSVFPAVDRWFDAIVAENGCVLAAEGMTRALAAPIELELDEALVGRGLPFRRGQVLLATHTAHEADVTEELRRLGLECQLVRNRGELMVLPSGVSKGFGVYQALGDLGISHHSTVAIGDAENDHSLLRGCELGVAVENAVASLKRHADLVLEKPGAAGVAEFLRGPVLSGEAPVEPHRWQIELGVDSEGAPVRIPASQINVLVAGRSNGGKSFLAGILAEQLIGLGYSLCIVDPEGDYAPLGRLRGTVHLGGAETLPRPEQVERFIEHRFGSVLLDLSLTNPADRERYVPALLARLEAERSGSGLPHWILLDEAHHLRPGAGSDWSGPAKGHCVVTYRPDALSQEIRESIDIVLAVSGGTPDRGASRDPLEALEDLYGLDLGAVRSGRPGTAVVARPKVDASLRSFTMRSRTTRHVRHWHKYFGGSLRPALRFRFRGESGEVQHEAGNVEDLRRVVAICAPDVIRHHARRGDLSRWLRQAIQDFSLGGTVEDLEHDFRSGSQGDAEVEPLRRALLQAIDQRYFDPRG